MNGILFVSASELPARTNWTLRAPARMNQTLKRWLEHETGLWKGRRCQFFRLWDLDLIRRYLAVDWRLGLLLPGS
ncbi:unnamed protein product [Rhizophagus irregularis]|nr:unnamed protein product [Rhizophagus irregularis]